MTKKLSKSSVRNKINKEFSRTVLQYEDEIPMDKIMTACEKFGGLVVDEAGESWSGIFCGRNGNANIEVKFDDYTPMYIVLNWYKMPSGRYEIVVYIS